MTDPITIQIIEQPGKLGDMKASQLARLVEAYAIAHPEITERPDHKEDTP